MTVDEVHLTIDGVAVTVPKGTLLVEAAKRVNEKIPVYCYHEKLGPAGLCRVCLVEIEGAPKLQIACNTPVTDGMVVHTHNERVDGGRRAILEMLLLNHPLDCPICDKGGECDLQDFTIAYGPGKTRMTEPKEHKPKAIDLGPTIVLDQERCIVCQRCTRFEDLISQEHGLVVKERGAHDEIATATDAPYRSAFTGNVTELCPVGALTSKTYRFRSRPWDNHRAESTCTQCALGCSLFIDQRLGVVTRTMSRQDDPVSDGWLCDRGRYTFAYLDDDRRLRTPLLRRDGVLVPVSWSEAMTAWSEALRHAGDPQTVATLGGARLLNEEAYLLQALMRGWGSPHLDWRTGRRRQALTGRGAGTLEGLEQADVIVVVGIPPMQSTPVLDLRLRKAVKCHGTRLISVGAYGAAQTVGETRLRRLSEVRAALPEGLKCLALLWDGIDPAAGRELAVLAAEYAKNGVEVATYLVGDAPNGVGAESMGLHPRYKPHYEQADLAGLDTEGILAAARAGRLNVLSIFGADPVLSFPDGPAVRRALESVPFVVVTELFATPTTDLATLVLPVASSLERTGHTTNLLGMVQAVNAGSPLPDGIRTEGEILLELAAHLGVTLPAREIVAAAASRALDPARTASFALGDERLCGHTPPPRGEPTHGELTVTIGQSIFAGSGTMAHDRPIAALRETPSLALAPATAELLGVVADATADLVSGARRLTGLRIRIDERLAEGRIGLIDGLAEAPANTFLDGMAVQLEDIRLPEAVLC